MFRRFRRAWKDFRNALELHSEYDITLWDTWKIMHQKPDPDSDSASPPDIYEMVSRKVDERRMRLRRERNERH